MRYLFHPPCTKAAPANLVTQIRVLVRHVHAQAHTCTTVPSFAGQTRRFARLRVCCRRVAEPEQGTKEEGATGQHLRLTQQKLHKLLSLPACQKERKLAGQAHKAMQEHKLGQCAYAARWPRRASA